MTDEEPLSLMALAQELKTFGLHETCQKAEEMFDSGEISAPELFDCFQQEYLQRSNQSKDLEVLLRAVEKLFSEPSEEVLDLGNWYLLQKPPDGLSALYSLLMDLDVDDTKLYLLISANVLVIQCEQNVRAIYEFFERNGGGDVDHSPKDLDDYFSAFKQVGPDGRPDILHISTAITRGNFSFIGDNAIKFRDEETGFEDSFNVTNLTKLCNSLEIKIRLVSLVGHYFLVLKKLEEGS